MSCEELPLTYFSRSICRLITVHNNRASTVLQPCVSCRPTEIAYGTEDNEHKHLSQFK